MTDRTIFHIDVNSAFLSWSALKKLAEDPEGIDLRTIPSAVGGDIRTRHGVITAKSIPAKAYGVQTGEPVLRALEKCPQLVLVPSDFAVYRKYSGQFMDLLRTYTDQVQPASIDEAYLDVTKLQDGQREDFPLALAGEIKDRVRRELGFTVNVGISTNKFLAKMASDFEKPDRVHTLYPEEIPAKLWPLPLRALYGCGQATAARLGEMGFVTIGETAACEEALLQSVLGEKLGTYIHRRANGLDDSPLETDRQDAKSYSNETTTSEDIDAANYQRLGVPIVKALSEKVAKRLQKDGVYGATVTVAIKTGRFRRHSRQTTLPEETSDAAVIARTAMRLMEELVMGETGFFARGEVLRLIGVGVSNLSDGRFRQMNLLEWAKDNEGREAAREKQRKLERMLETVRARYGEDSLKRGG